MTERMNQRQRDLIDEACAELADLRRAVAVDPERAHALADEVLLDLLAALHPRTAEVADAYRLLVALAPWWAAA